MTEKHQTLLEYYQSLSQAGDKSKFIRNIAKQCDVTPNTVRNWVVGDYKITAEKKLEIISKETGIPVDNLFKTLTNV